MALENTPTSTHPTSNRGVVNTWALPGADRRDGDGADRQADSETGHAAPELGDARADHDVQRPHRRGGEDPQQPDRVVADLEAAEDDDPEAASNSASALRAVRVIAATMAIGPMNSMATLLPRSVRARPMKKNVFISAVAMPNTAAASNCGRVHRCSAPGETRISTTAALATRSHATVAGRPRRTATWRSCARVLGDRRARTAARRGGVEVARQGANGTSRSLAEQSRVPPEAAPRTHGERRRTAYSNSSGSDVQMSCHSGWKLNQPASGKPVCSRV